MSLYSGFFSDFLTITSVTLDYEQGNGESQCRTAQRNHVLSYKGSRHTIIRLHIIMSDAEAARPSAKMENLINEALSIVQEFSSEPGMDLYFKHCREYLPAFCMCSSVLPSLREIEKILIDILSLFVFQ